MTSNIYEFKIENEKGCFNKSFDFSRVTQNIKNKAKRKEREEKLSLLSPLNFKTQRMVIKTEESEELDSPSNFSQPESSQPSSFVFRARPSS